MSNSSTITDDIVLPSTVGVMLVEDFLEPLGIAAADLAAHVGVPPAEIETVIAGGAIDGALDLRLGRYFGLRPGYFIGLQTSRELRLRRLEIGDELDRIIPRAA